MLLKTFLLLVFYILTGVMMPLLIELVSTNGGADKSTMLIALPNSIGMMCCILTNWPARNTGKVRWNVVFAISFFEMLAQVLNMNGLIYAGSAIFTVIYSSITIYTAVFSYVFLNRQLHVMQWVGVVVVMVGLAMTSLSAKNDGIDVEFGVFLILLGTAVHSFTYIMSEYLLVVVEDAIAPQLLSSILGAIGSFLILCWQLIYTLPNYQTKVVDEFHRHKDGSIEVILVSYLVLSVNAMVHALCFFALLGSVGSTTTSVSKGVQSVAIFIASHYAFCLVQESQCFTPLKGCSLAVVIIGVTAYSSFKYKPKQYHEILEVDLQVPKDVSTRPSFLQRFSSYL